MTGGAKKKKIIPKKAKATTDTKPFQKEICYIKYDQKNMKYFYLCCNCKTAWKIIGVEKEVQLISY